MQRRHVATQDTWPARHTATSCHPSIQNIIPAGSVKTTATALTRCAATGQVDSADALATASGPCQRWRCRTCLGRAEGFTKNAFFAACLARLQFKRARATTPAAALVEPSAIGCAQHCGTTCIDHAPIRDATKRLLRN